MSDEDSDDFVVEESAARGPTPPPDEEPQPKKRFRIGKRASATAPPPPSQSLLRAATSSAPKAGRRQSSAHSKSVARASVYGSEVCGNRVSILFSGDGPNSWFTGVVKEFSAASGKHYIRYDDGDQQWHYLGQEEASKQLRWAKAANPAASSRRGGSSGGRSRAGSSSLAAVDLCSPSRDRDDEEDEDEDEDEDDSDDDDDDDADADDDDDKVEVVNVVRGGKRKAATSPKKPPPRRAAAKAASTALGAARSVDPIDVDEEDDAAAADDDDDDDVCWTCGQGGELLLCDGCEAQHHNGCVGLAMVPEGEWLCPDCEAKAAAGPPSAGEAKRKGGKQPRGAKTKSRKLIDDDQLAASTKAAIEAERQRRSLIMPKAGAPAYVGAAEGAEEAAAEEAAAEEGAAAAAAAAAEGEGYLLNPSEADKDGRLGVRISPALAALMKAHQLDACRFLFDNIVVTVGAWRAGNPGLGALLAHSMGLGKTCTALALVDALLTSRALRAPPVAPRASAEASGAASENSSEAAACVPRRLRTVLVVAPATVLDNWLDEMDKWRSHAAYGCFRVSADETVKKRLAVLAEWQRAGGVCIIGFEAFLSLTTRSATEAKARPLLQDPGPDLIILDEGHRIKNCKGKQHQALSACASPRRLILSGTPLQNNLLEYHAMLSFVRPGLLGTEKEFRNRFVNPIMHGSTADASAADQRLSRMRMAVLHDLVEPFVHRRSAELLRTELPPKYEVALTCRLTDVQRRLYGRFLATKGRGGTPKSIIASYSTLQQIFNHPATLYRALAMQGGGKAREASAYDSMDDFLASEEEARDSGSDSDAAQRRRAKAKQPGGKKGAAAAAAARGGEAEAAEVRLKGGKKAKGAIIVSDDDEEEEEEGGAARNGAAAKGPSAAAGGGGMAGGAGSEGAGAAADATSAPEEGDVEWYEAEREVGEEASAELSGKVLVFLGLLEACAQQGERTLLFSQSLHMLDVLEALLAQRPRAAADGLRWKRGRDWLRLDGSTKQSQRMRMVDHFQDEASDARLFLISTTAGNLGINLTAATRVVLFDSSWNPSSDAQAIFRAWRFGQTRPVFVYRLLGAGTIEEKIYARQISKQGIIGGVCDDESLAKAFSKDELSDLFSLSPPPPTPSAAQLEHPEVRFGALAGGTDDRTLRRLLKAAGFGAMVTGITAHDSLVQADETLGLSAEEREAAKAAFEQEMQPPKPPPPPPAAPQLPPFAPPPQLGVPPQLGGLLPPLGGLLPPLSGVLPPHDSVLPPGLAMTAADLAAADLAAAAASPWLGRAASSEVAEEPRHPSRDESGPLRGLPSSASSPPPGAPPTPTPDGQRQPSSVDKAWAAVQQKAAQQQLQLLQQQLQQQQLQQQLQAAQHAHHVQAAQHAHNATAEQQLQQQLQAARAAQHVQTATAEQQLQAMLGAARSKKGVDVAMPAAIGAGDNGAGSASSWKPIKVYEPSLRGKKNQKPDGDVRPLDGDDELDQIDD